MIDQSAPLPLSTNMFNYQWRIPFTIAPLSHLKKCRVGMEFITLGKIWFALNCSTKIHYLVKELFWKLDKHYAPEIIFELGNKMFTMCQM